jgi:hypothetical protein
MKYLAQKLQCTFKVDVPEMGHLGGGNERDVSDLSSATAMHFSYMVEDQI